MNKVCRLFSVVFTIPFYTFVLFFVWGTKILCCIIWLHTPRQHDRKLTMIQLLYIAPIILYGIEPSTETSPDASQMKKRGKFKHLRLMLWEVEMMVMMATTMMLMMMMMMMMMMMRWWWWWWRWWWWWWGGGGGWWWWFRLWVLSLLLLFLLYYY